jgi:hypothetical protein
LMSGLMKGYEFLFHWSKICQELVWCSAPINGHSNGDPSSDARTSHSPNGKCVSIWNMLSTTFYLGNPGLDGKQIKEF